MTISNVHRLNRNDARSAATRARLIESTIAALIELGFTKTTGVEVCRRSGLTRGALNHHFPDFPDLYVATLGSLYERLLDVRLDLDCSPLERVVLESYERVSRPEFKAVIELWLASRNDPEFGSRLALAIEQSAELFSPDAMLADASGLPVDEAMAALYRTITEALIGIGLGRAVGRGESMAHEASVVAVLCELARSYGRAARSDIDTVGSQSTGNTP
ncbi:MAG: TetR/AcrR family transcriptional regulator [Congregibacter sp.]|nr:TetR/AcrR family transcriptional regulator [Congregibacter sp.]MDP5070904.1 TetR/AcrR family transcriptional regulator [Congregibacter sp.]